MVAIITVLCKPQDICKYNTHKDNRKEGGGKAVNRIGKGGRECRECRECMNIEDMLGRG